MKLTDAEVDVLIHRLESTTVQEVLCDEDEYDYAELEAEINILMIYIKNNKALPDNLQLSAMRYDIFKDCVEGSTYFIHEDSDMALADSLEKKMCDYLGTEVKFPRN